MEMIIRKNNYLIIIMILIFLTSCDSKNIFNQYTSIPNGSWEANQKVTFNFTIKDTISKRNLFINLRNNKHYQFSNIYLITTLHFPNNTKIIDTLQYEMADATGKFLGSGFSDIKENKLFYKEEKAFPISGNYTFEVYQAMRKNGQINGIEFLEGVTDVGFSIEKTN
ncbi:MAG: gliding motility lipoprotein GldH [Polaribacter sp.]